MGTAGVNSEARHFASADVARTWPYIVRSVERIVTRCELAVEGQLDWRPTPEANSLGVLATHACGNLEHRLLGMLCGRERQRDRESEFETAGLPAGAIRVRWETLRLELDHALAELTDADLDREFVHPERGHVTGHEILLIAARHMAEHEGQSALTFDLWPAGRSRD